MNVFLVLFSFRKLDIPVLFPSALAAVATASPFCVVIIKCACVFCLIQNLRSRVSWLVFVLTSLYREEKDRQELVELQLRPSLSSFLFLLQVSSNSNDYGVQIRYYTRDE